jgi:hypothetical protein
MKLIYNCVLLKKAGITNVYMTKITINVCKFKFENYKIC